MDIRATHNHASTTGVDRNRLPPKGLTDAQIQENKQKERADFFAKTHQKEAEQGKRNLKEYLKGYFQHGIDDILKEAFWDKMVTDKILSVQAFGFLPPEYIDEVATQLELVPGRRALLQKARSDAAQVEGPRQQQNWHGGGKRQRQLPR